MKLLLKNIITLLTKPEVLVLQRNIIEINGHKYDAISGKSLSGLSQISKPVIDGVSRVAKPVSDRQPVRRTKQASTHRNIKKLEPHPQRSKTLLRNIVKKPFKTIYGQSSPLEAKPEPMQTTSNWVNETERERLKRINKVHRSDLIQKFNLSAPQNNVAKVIRKVAPMPIAKHPDETSNRPAESNDRALHLPKSVFEHSIEDAVSHKAKKLKKGKLHHRVGRKLGLKPKAAGIASSLLVGMLVLGFIAYQNVPAFAMRVAANRAGFNASMPGYTPSGFAADKKISYSKGQVSVNFHSKTDSRSYTIAQQPTNWSNENLADNFLRGRADNFQTSQAENLTLYIYDGSNATWVDNGIWYVIGGNSSLSYDQIVNIATSM